MLDHVVDCELVGLRSQPLAEIVRIRLHILTKFDVASLVENTCQRCRFKNDCSNAEKIKESKKELRSKCNQIRKTNQSEKS